MKFIISSEVKKQLHRLYPKKMLRIFPKIKTWAGITYKLVQDELAEGKDNLYKIEDLLFIIDKEEEKEVSYIEIDYENDWAGEDFIITAGF